jgi:hypothetical protein
MIRSSASGIHMVFVSLVAMMVWMTFALIFRTSNGSPSWCSTSVHSIGSSGEYTSLLSLPSAEHSLHHYMGSGRRVTVKKGNVATRENTEHGMQGRAEQLGLACCTSEEEA